jgi:hypothetical protein
MRCLEAVMPLLPLSPRRISLFFIAAKLTISALHLCSTCNNDIWDSFSILLCRKGSGSSNDDGDGTGCPQPLWHRLEGTRIPDCPSMITLRHHWTPFLCGFCFDRRGHWWSKSIPSSFEGLLNLENRHSLLAILVRS